MMCHIHTVTFFMMGDEDYFLTVISYFSRLVVYKPEAEELSTDYASRLYETLPASFTFTHNYNITNSMYASIIRLPA